MATAVHNLTGTDTPEKSKYDIGVLAGLEYSPVPNAELSQEEINAMKELVTKGSKRDYPARLIEVIQAWEAALFYRGFQFLIPQRGGGWVIPGESTGYGPSMQMDLALLPTNIYSARGQMIIAALTRTVPSVRFAPADANSDAGITAAESAGKYVKVISRNNDLIMIQTDGARYLWNDGRYLYWSRYVKDGQKFGWEEDDVPDDLVPESEGGDPAATNVENAAAAVTPESSETAQEAGGRGAEEQPAQMTEVEEEASQADDTEEGPAEFVKRTPRGQEVRTAHGKLEVKLVPMMANEMAEVDLLIYETEVDESRAKGMMPWIADKITASSKGTATGEIARLARQNVKLGMQSSYVTSDSVACDVTIQRTWMRPCALMGIPKEEMRDKLIAMFPNGCLFVMAGDVFAYARNESMDDSWALAQAYSGDGQNRNAMGTSTLPIQKRLNNWLDLMNDIFVRTIPKKWMDAKVFSVEALRGQTNVPGDIGGFKRQPGVPVSELIFVEPAVNPPVNLAEFIKEYSGPLAELLSGAYPALAGGDVGTADSGVAIATQRDSALGRLAPTWHSMKNAEATSMKQLVRWGAKCRDGSINEKIPGGETISIEINDLKGNILCFAESDENFPETYTQRKNGVLAIFQDAAKNPQLQEVMYNAANLEFLQNVLGLTDFYLEQVASRNKQLGEIEILLKTGTVPSPMVAVAQQKLEQLKASGLLQPEQLTAAEQQIKDIPEVCSMDIDAEVDDNRIEAATCWQYLTSDEGRKMKRKNIKAFNNVRLHFLQHKQAADQSDAAKMQNAAPKKPPSVSVGYKDVALVDKGASDQILQEAGITPSPGAATPPPVPSPAGAAPAAIPKPAGAAEGAGGLPKQ